MPLSPTTLVNDLESVRAYKEASRRLDQLAQAGMSWSGNERNCVFLNTAGERFANISAASGFDFADDGRSLALVDWDHDGDLDVWAANRTGPRLRFLRNDANAGHHFVAFRLVGRSANRDGIGARLELIVADDSGRRTLIKTLRAGEGFLGQSSKWLHFGLGTSGRVAQLVVRWPAGGVDRFAVETIDKLYVAAEGASSLQPWQPPSGGPELQPAVSREPAPSGEVQLLLPTRVPLPWLDYTALDGEAHRVDELAGQPLLISLWASWCPPCLSELAELARQHDQLRQRGIRVLALSVDALGQDGLEPAKLREFAERLQLPFPVGVAPAPLVDKLQIVHDLLFKPHRPLPLPASVLLDAQGQLAALYKGPVTPERLMRDAAALSETGPRLLATALPFPGRWEAPPMALRLLPLAAALVEQGFLAEVDRYADAHRDELARDAGFPELLYRLGREHLARGDLSAALERFHQALQLRPNDADGYFNLGIAKAAQNDWDAAIQLYQQAIQIEPSHARAINNLGNVYVQRREYDRAELSYRQAIDANPNLADVRFNLGVVYQQQGRTDNAAKQFAEAVRLEPGHAQAHNNLAIILSQRQDFDAAAIHYQQAVQFDPQYASAHNNLANLLALQGKLAEAVQHYRQAITIDPRMADAHDNLGRVLLAMNQAPEAIEQLRRAAQLQPDQTQTTSLLAWLLATHPDDALRRPDEALEWASRAVEGTKRQDPRALDVLAAAQASSGNFAAAIQTGQEAIGLLEQSGRGDQAAPLRRRLEGYRRGEAFRLQRP